MYNSIKCCTYKIPYWKALNIIHNNRFSKLSKGRELSEEDKKSHYRKGVIGDWKNHFKESHKIFFKEKYGDLLIKLGYEKDNDW